MRKIGAIWTVPARKAKQIHPDLDCDCIIAVSEDTNYWFAGPDIFFSLKVGQEFGLEAVSILGAQDYPWGNMRDALLEGRLGPPDAGYGRIYEDLKKKVQRVQFSIPKQTCKCNWQRLSAMGCPTSKGGQCPTIAGLISKDDVYR